MKSFWTAPLLGVVGGLVLLLASAAGWVDIVSERDVGGVTIAEPESTSGTTYAPAAVVFGLGALAVGALLALVRGAGRRVLGGILAAVGLGGLVTVAFGLPDAWAAGGRVTPSPFLALAAGVGVLVAGAAALRGPARPPAARPCRVEGERPGDDEWALAADDGEPDD